VRQEQKLASKNGRMIMPPLLKVSEAESQLVSAQTICCTHGNKSVCMAVVQEGSLF